MKCWRSNVAINNLNAKGGKKVLPEVDESGLFAVSQVACRTTRAGSTPTVTEAVTKVATGVVAKAATVVMAKRRTRNRRLWHVSVLQHTTTNKDNITSFWNEAKR
jgi:hypothetical protein